MRNASSFLNIILIIFYCLKGQIDIFWHLTKCETINDFQPIRQCMLNACKIFARFPEFTIPVDEGVERVIASYVSVAKKFYILAIFFLKNLLV